VSEEEGRTETEHWLLCVVSGCWFQAGWRAVAAQDVVPEHEDEAHRSRHHRRSDPHHNPLNLPWRMRQVI